MEQNKYISKNSKHISRKTKIIIFLTLILSIILMVSCSLFYLKVIKKAPVETTQTASITLQEQMSAFKSPKKEISSIGGVCALFGEQLPTASQIKELYKQNSITILINPFDLYYNKANDYFISDNSPLVSQLKAYITEMKTAEIKVFLQYNPLFVYDTNNVLQKKFPFLQNNIQSQENLLYLKSNEYSAILLDKMAIEISLLDIDGVILDSTDENAIISSSMAIKNAGKFAALYIPESITDTAYNLVTKLDFIDFAVLGVDATTQGKIDNFGSIVKEKIKAFASANIKTIIFHQTSASSPILPYCLASTYSNIKDSENYIGSIFSLRAIKNTDALNALLLLYDNKLDFDVAKTQLVITSPENNFKTDKSTVIIAGTCDNNFPLTMNGNEIKPSDKGLFSIDVNLKQGNNKFEFSHKGKTEAVNIIYDFEIIKSLSPSRDITISSNSEMGFSVTALSNASVSGSVGSIKLKFVKGSAKLDEEGNVVEGYSEFTANFISPTVKGKKSIGTFTASASLNGVTKSLSGGTIYVENKFEYKPPINNNNNGNGNQGVENPTGYIAEINENFGEILNSGASGGNLNLATPLYGFLSRGTKDYIVGEMFYKDNKYYKLSSGYRAYQNECKIYKSEENLYSNITNITTENTGMYTDITLAGSNGNLYTVDFNVPFADPSRFAFDCIFNTDTVSFDISNVVSSVDISNLTSPLFSGSTFLKISDTKYRLTLKLRYAGKFFGYKSYMNSNGELVLRLKNPKHATGGRLDGFKILVDPGHSGDNYNFSPFYPRDTSKSESTLNLNVSRYLKSELESLGANVEMTRYNATDKNELGDTQMRLLGGDYDFYVAIHHNSSSSSKVSGQLTLYFYPFNEGFSGSMFRSLDALGLYPSQSSYLTNRFQNVKMLRQNSTIGGLCELGYNTNQYDIGIITNSDHQRSFAKQISHGVVNFFQ